jgi:hypothetical protein
MSRIRNVKPDFFRHEGLQDLERINAGKYSMFVFEGLWTKCDRQGIFEWKSRSLKLDILPFLDFDMEDTLSILETAGYIEKYEVEGKEYGVIPTFLKHQKISKAEKDNINVFPLPPKNSKPIENHQQTDDKPTQDGLKTVFEPTQDGFETPEYGVRSTEYGNLKTENGNSECADAPDFSFSDFSQKGIGRDDNQAYCKPQQDGHPPIPLPISPPQNKDDVTTLYNIARGEWNRRQIKPEARDIIIPPKWSGDVIRVFQNYTKAEVLNAIANYNWHKSGRCGPSYSQPPPYGSIYGFLISGVSRYFDDNAIDQQFREGKNGKG